MEVLPKHLRCVLVWAEKLLANLSGEEKESSEEKKKRRVVVISPRTKWRGGAVKHLWEVHSTRLPLLEIHLRQTDKRERPGDT